MNNINSAYNSKHESAKSACALCEGVFAHESWCATRDPGASYAFQIVVDASKITPWGSLITPFAGCRLGAGPFVVCSLNRGRGTVVESEKRSAAERTPSRRNF
jgi:hypothetical protein